MKLPEDIQTKGYFLKDEFLSQSECEDLLNLIDDYRQQFVIPKIYRNVKPIPLSYSVIDGEKIKSHLTKIQTLYETCNEFVNNIIGEELFPLKDIKVGCNVNITNKGGTYRWHYDRNAVTAILYLNEVDGGEIECYPNYRIILNKLRFSRFQSFLDRILQISFVRNIFGKGIVIKPKPGLLLVMCGNKCLHSVRPVSSKNDKDRINIVMAYDMPGASFAIEKQLNTYLYSSENIQVLDPNYDHDRS
ncbi:MAG: 2OG-Fe(II) oxygenase [Cyanobacteria bacterium J06635_10]